MVRYLSLILLLMILFVLPTFAQIDRATLRRFISMTFLQ
jgi:hypothetical protein